MDWFTWLSKTGLDQALVYEYGLAFTHNELVEDDISYFDHEFLQSMGISVAKHRLEILKISRENRSLRHRPDLLLPRLLVAIKSTKRRFEEFVKSWVVYGEEESSSSALVVHHMNNKDHKNYTRRSSNNYIYGRCYGSPMKRKKKAAPTELVTATPSNRLLVDGGGAVMGRLLLTDGRSTPARDMSSGFARSPVVGVNGQWSNVGKKKANVEEGQWSKSAGGVEEIRWDSLFQDLKPT